MSNEEIMEGNKLIAEFRGARLVEESIMHRAHFVFDDGSSRMIKDLKHHVSWDWLINPWLKFVQDPWINKNYPDFSEVKVSIFKGNADLTFRLLVKALKWYNSQIQS